MHFSKASPDAKVYKSMNWFAKVREQFDLLGHGNCTSTVMFKEELKAEIEKLEQELSTKEKDYIDAIHSHKDYNTLRSIRNNMSK